MYPNDPVRPFPPGLALCRSLCVNLGAFVSSKVGEKKSKPGYFILSCLMAQIFKTTNDILPDKNAFFSRVETIKQDGLYQQGKKKLEYFAALAG